MKKNNTKLHIIIAFLIYAVFAFLLPVSEPMTKAGMQTLGVLFMTIYLWMNVSVGWPSVLCIFMFGTTGICTAGTVLVKSWGYGMTSFMIFCFLLNYAMRETGLSRRLALWFVTRKFVKGKPWLTMTTFLFSVVVVSLFVTSSAVGAMFLSIAEEMFDNTGYTEEDDLTHATVASIAWLANAGQGMTPMSHAVILLVLGIFAETFGFEVSVLTFSAAGIAYGLVFFILFMFVFRFIIRPNVEKMRHLDIDYLRSTVPPMDTKERWVTICFAAMILMWVTPDILVLIPFLEPLGSFLKSLGNYLPAFLMVSVLCVVQVDNKPVLDLKEASRNINWISVYMMATLGCMAAVVQMPEGGITEWISSKVGVLLGGMPALLFVVLSIAFILALTNFVSNTVCGVLFSAIVPIAMMIPGINPMALGLCIMAASNYGQATPAACPVTGMVASTKWVTPKYLMKYGWFVSAAALIAIVCVAYPIWSFIFPA